MAVASLPRCFGVLGDPIAHSRSPAMQQAAFSALELPHRYLPFHVGAADLGAALAGARALGFGGLNLTVPHKVAACDLLDALDPSAAGPGAVNTVCFTPRGAVGHNTDGVGFVRALAERAPGVAAAPGRVLLLGSGGAARAVAHALLAAGCEGLWWASRSPERLPTWPGVRPVAYGELDRVSDLDLLVNGTTVGMAGGPARFPAPIPLDRVRSGGAVADLVYPAPPGGLLAHARTRGLTAMDGLPMLLWQGVAALELWLSSPALPEAAVTAMAGALGLDRPT